MCSTETIFQQGKTNKHKYTYTNVVVDNIVAEINSPMCLLCDYHAVVFSDGGCNNKIHLSN